MHSSRRELYGEARKEARVRRGRAFHAPAATGSRSRGAEPTCKRKPRRRAEAAADGAAARRLVQGTQAQEQGVHLARASSCPSLRAPYRSHAHCSIISSPCTSSLHACSPIHPPLLALVSALPLHLALTMLSSPPRSTFHALCALLRLASMVFVPTAYVRSL